MKLMGKRTWSCSGDSHFALKLTDNAMKLMENGFENDFVNDFVNDPVHDFVNTKHNNLKY